jgi:hypothetical protein
MCEGSRLTRNGEGGELPAALASQSADHADILTVMIRKLASGGYRLYSRKKDPKTGKRKNLGTFKSLVAAKKHERAVQFFKRL